MLKGPEFSDRHLIFGEGSSFVTADIVSTSHSLTGSEISDQVIFIFHLSNAVGKGDGDCQGETFGHCHHDQADCDNDSLDYFLHKLDG